MGLVSQEDRPPSIMCTLLSLCPPLLHHIHLTTFTQTDILSETILQIGLECVALRHPRRPGKPVTIISPLQGLSLSLLSADLCCCWLRLTSSQSSTCTELFCFALLDTKMQFSAALSPLIGPSNYPLQRDLSLFTRQIQSFGNYKQGAAHAANSIGISKN